MIFDYFDGAFYLNLDKRPERKEAFERRIKEIGIEVERFSALELKEEDVANPFNENDWHIKLSCTHSHFEMIKEAKKRGWKNCVIFEDDCVFANGFIEKIKLCVEELKTLDWDIFYLGGEPDNPCEPISDNISKCPQGLYGTHAYVINESFYDNILSLNYNYGIIDTIYKAIGHNKYYMSKELLAWQDDEFVSDLWRQKINREKIYQDTYKTFVI
jgi:hypothetical protein